MLTEMAAAKENHRRDDTITKVSTADKNDEAPIPPPSSKQGKRRHYDTTADVQMRVLVKEEELQRKKEKIMEVEYRKMLLDEEVAILKKRKLSLEVAQLEAAATVQQNLVVDFIPNSELF